MSDVGDADKGEVVEVVAPVEVEERTGDESGEDIEMDGSETEALFIWIVGSMVVVAGAANS